MERKWREKRRKEKQGEGEPSIFFPSLSFLIISFFGIEILREKTLLFFNFFSFPPINETQEQTSFYSFSFPLKKKLKNTTSLPFSSLKKTSRTGREILRT